MSGRVKMRDVAEAVGMSPMTVSRALRGDKSVSAATRDKIRQTARALGYVYDSTAQAFRTQKSGFVAVTLPSLNNANFAETYRALSDGLAPSGLQLLLGATNYRPENEEQLVSQLLTRNPEALVMTGGHHTDATRDLVLNRGLPVIEIWDLPAKPLGHVVGFSNAGAMEKMVAHLVSAGRRKLAYIGSSAGADHRGADRRAGVIAAAREFTLPDVTLLDAGPAPVSMRHGAAVIDRIGHGILEFDAVICVSDPVAFGVLSACRRLGIDVPGQIAITGFGHFEVAAISAPRITTIDANAHQIGQVVADMLNAFTTDSDAAPLVEVGTKLVVGQTS